MKNIYIFLLKIITTFLDENDVLTETQNGFYLWRTRLKPHLKHFLWLLEQQVNNSNVDVRYLSFSKTFDKAYHGMIRYKLRYLGTAGKLGTWLHDFLIGSTRAVTANGPHWQSWYSSVESHGERYWVHCRLRLHAIDMTSSISSVSLTSIENHTKCRWCSKT